MSQRSSSTLSVETLEDRVMPDAALLQSVPPSLLGNALIVEWNAEHDTLTNLSDRMQTLQTAVRQVTGEVATDQSLIGNNESSLSGTRQNLLSSLDRQQALTLQSANLQTKETSLRTEQTSALQRITQLQTEVAGFRTQLTTVSAQRTDLQNQLNPLLLQMQQLQKDLASVTQELKLRPKNQKLLRQQTTIKTSIALLQPKIDTLNMQIADITKQMAALQTGVQNDTTLITTLQSRLALIPDEIASTHAQWVTVQTTLQTLANTIAIQQQTVAQIQTALDAAIAELVHDQSALQTASQDLFALQADLEKETALVERLDGDVSNLVERTLAAEKVPETIVPAMHATVDHEPGWGFKMHIRYQTPSDTGFFQISEFGRLNSFAATEVLDHPGGIKDKTIELSNRGDPWAEVGVVAIRMMDGPGGKIFQTMYGIWNSSTRRLDILTKQPASFEDAVTQTTEQVKENIDPGMQVETEGRIVAVRFQTASDQSLLQISRAGVMDAVGSGARESFTHTGGTRGGLAQLAIPSDTPANTNLVLRLWDKSWGNVVSEVALHYDGTTVQVVSGQKPVGNTPMPHAELLNAMSTANAQIRAITAAALYERCSYFIDGSTLEQRLAAAFPSIFPKDINAAVEQMYQAGATYTRGFYLDQLLQQQSDYRSEYRAVLNAYANNMADLLTASVDFWIRVRSGEAERPLSDALHWKYDTTNFGAINVLGIPKPNFNQILDAGHDLSGCQRELLIQAHLDNLTSAARTAYLESQAIAAQNIPTLTVISADAHRRTMQTIQQTSGTGTPEERLANYIKANPDAYPLLSDIAPVATRTIVSALLYPDATPTGTLVASAATPDSLVSYLESVVIHKQLGTLSEQSFAWPVAVSEGQSYTIGFSVTQPMLIDGLASVNAFEEAGIVIRSKDGTIIANTTVGTLTQSGAGGKIHQTLFPGEYRLTITGRASSKFAAIPVNIGGTLAPTSSALIQGMVEMEGRQTKVNLSVAEFNATGERKGMSNVKSLNPNLPLWLVVHGMNSSDRSDPLLDVARALSHYDMQIVTVNWEEAAKDGLVTQDAQWTPAVGKWIGDQLLAAGFAPSAINGAGWSHGSYVLFHMSEEIEKVTNGKQMNALVALDPAGNIPLLSGYDQSKIDFKKHSRNSVAFEGSPIAGSDALTATADVSFHINPPEVPTMSISTRHSLPVTAFASILEHERLSPGAFSEHLSLTRIMTPAENVIQKEKLDAYDGIFEGIIDVTVTEKQGTDGKYYSIASPTVIHFVEPLIYKEIAQNLNS
ncbi:hypothetical protein HZA87_01790 [Candidatus Uhrbacteria bacterium]|nr:hypothetical protein [Candidatus Uhrbacteria bacterium]